MTCEELQPDYELYVLGASEDPERSELTAHLRGGCQACTAGVRTARGTMAMFATTVSAATPSPKLRRRIMAAAGVERSNWILTPLWIAATALSLMVAFYFYGRDRDNALQLARSRAESRTQAIELAHLNEALALLNQPDTRQVTFGEGTSQPPRGRVFVNPKIGVLLVASNLPAAPAGKTYEMWLIPKTGNPVPAGLFQSSGEGSALHLQNATVDLAATKAIAVTLEPAGGVPQPTSQPLIVAVL
jgi:anti-sigma-K factor RskA